MSRKTLVVVTGATASGKTALAVEIASRLGCEIVSADSRQIYRDIPIATAAPSAAELLRVRHHFIGTLPLEATCSAADYEVMALDTLARLFDAGDYAVLCGGSMMYVDAVTDGIDIMPSIDNDLRDSLLHEFQTAGIAPLLERLRRLDPVSWSRVDHANPRRVLHALEVCEQSGRPYSSFLGHGKGQRPFDIVKIAVDMPREQLFARINSRVEAMVALGLVDEARAVYDRRQLNSLNTVGLKEMFAYIAGDMSLDEAMARMAKNTRVYAKKQLTWLRRPSVRPSVPVGDIADLRRLGVPV